MTRDNPPVLAIAERLIESGISFLPVAVDGTKAPASTVLPRDPDDPKGKKRTWKPFEERLPSKTEAHGWFGNGRKLGIGIIGGKVSGNLEHVDFDAVELIEPFEERLEETAPGLLARLVKTETPRPGGGVTYRAETAVEGNQVLAWGLRPDPETGELKKEKLIETRGEGGYFVSSGSPLEVHETGRPYLTIQGDLAEPPVITAAERQAILSCARSFNEYVEPERFVRQSTPTPRAEGSDLLPGDDFNERGDVAALLQQAGWAEARWSGETQLWRRPGKTKGHSATLHHVAPNVLYVFSSSAPPFEPDHAYGAFAVYTLLEHRGDYSAAGKALYNEGYGDRRKPEQAPVPGDEDVPPERGAAVVSSDTILSPVVETTRGDRLDNLNVRLSRGCPPRSVPFSSSPSWAS